MGPDPWVVVLVRAWWEDGEFRARLIRTDADDRSSVAVVGSPEEAADRLRRWLENPSDG